VPGVASVQALAPARTEDEREFHALGTDAQKDWSSTVFNLKVGTAKVGNSNDLNAVLNFCAAQVVMGVQHRCGPRKSWSKFLLQCVFR